MTVTRRRATAAESRAINAELQRMRTAHAGLLKTLGDSYDEIAGNFGPLGLDEAAGRAWTNYVLSCMFRHPRDLGPVEPAYEGRHVKRDAR